MLSKALDYNWQLADFEYDLPKDLIAQVPAAERCASRLLHLAADGSICDRQFPDVESLLQAGDVLVLNNTEVVPARLKGCKETGGKVEIMVERILTSHSASALIKSSKSPKPGSLLFLEDCALPALQVKARHDDLFELVFPDEVLNVLNKYGSQPLPPYIERAPDASDSSRYQTVYAQKPGAVAAPTAGLHFDASLLARIKAKGVEIVYVTLHVGAGTFQPVRCQNIKDHKIHYEWVELQQAAADAINKAKLEGRRVVAVGTTAVRVLETAAQDCCVKAISQETNLFITPGFKFNIVDALITNFHLPCSSLLMLVSAFAGYEEIMQAYQHAVANKYRFFSYGDAMFLERK